MIFWISAATPAKIAALRRRVDIDRSEANVVVGDDRVDGLEA